MTNTDETTTQQPTEPATPHRYFIAIAYQHGVGSRQINLSQPIRSMADLDVVRNALLEASPHLGDMVITGWQRFED